MDEVHTSSLFAQHRHVPTPPSINNTGHHIHQLNHHNHHHHHHLHNQQQQQHDILSSSNGVISPQTLSNNDNVVHMKVDAASTGSQADSNDPDGDGDGVWSPDIEQSFQEALIMYPPCGRRKHILQDEGGGKMFGRNELIARYIQRRTGKSRTRKQVSSHIQVLARRRAKNDLSKNGLPSNEPSSTSSSTTNSAGSPSSSTSTTHPHHHQQLTNQPLQSNYFTASTTDVWEDREIVTQKIRLVEFSAFVEHRYMPDTPFRHNYVQIDYRLRPKNEPTPTLNNTLGNVTPNSLTTTTARSSLTPNHMTISSASPCSSASNSFKLESIDVSQIHDKFPYLVGPGGLIHQGPPDAFFLIKSWADRNENANIKFDDQNSFYFYSFQFETVHEYHDLKCSTKACSYGSEVVENVERRIHPIFNPSNGRYCYTINRSPMCTFMIQFIKKLHELPKRQQMNSVLENFTILQVITSESTGEILLCLAYVFEVAPEIENGGPQYHIYRLT